MLYFLQVYLKVEYGHYLQRREWWIASVSVQPPPLSFQEFCRISFELRRRYANQARVEMQAWADESEFSQRRYHPPVDPKIYSLERQLAL